MEEHNRGPMGLPHPDDPNRDINSLVVCLKTPATLPALSKLKPRLSPSSVITLIQNGMGVYDELCANLWPNPATRPFFILGTTTHGAKFVDFGSVSHANKRGEGEIKFGVVDDPRREVDFNQWLWRAPVADLPILAPPPSPSFPLDPPPPNASVDLDYITETLGILMSISHLSPSILPMPHLHHQLLLKLAINSVINPLTAVLGAGAIPNGALYNSAPAANLVDYLTAEVSAVLAAYSVSNFSPHAPPPDVVRLFSIDSIRRRILATIRATASNTSSMAADVSVGRLNELKYINGYVISMAKRLRVPVPSHRMVSAMVKFTAELNRVKNTADAEIPLRIAERQKEIKTALGLPRVKTAQEAENENQRLDLHLRYVNLREEELAYKQKQMARFQGESEARFRRVNMLQSPDQIQFTKEEWVLLPRLTQDNILTSLETQVAKRHAEASKASDAPVPTRDAISTSLYVPEGEEGFSTPPTRSTTADTPPPIRQKAETMSERMTRQIESAARQTTSESGATTIQGTPSVPSTAQAATQTSNVTAQFSSAPAKRFNLDSMISSAPRAQRSWGVDGGKIEGYTSSTSTTSEGEGVAGSHTTLFGTEKHLSKGGIGSSLDRLIAGSPRQERTWAPDRSDVGSKASGKFTTSRSSGS